MFISDIYAFHSDIGDQRLNETVPFWQSIWTKHGWTPHILTIADGAKHPDFERVWALAESMPTVNDRRFSAVNFLRWCAFARVNGAVTDYDVLPRTAFPPRDFTTMFTGDRDNGPGFLVGTCGDFERVMQAILRSSPSEAEKVNGMPHLCDMTIIRRHPEFYASREDLVRCFGVDGWRSVPLVHFGNSYLNSRQSKKEQMARILRLEGAIHE